MQNQTVIKTSWSDEFDEKFELESQGCSECGGFELIDKTEIRYPESEYHCEFDLDKVKSFISKVEKEAEERAYQRAVEEVGKSKDDAYHERDMLVCALSKLFPSYLARHDEKEEWEDDWRWIVYIEIPTGQVSWHIHDSEIEMFDHLEVKENNWDGHNTERKYQRLSKLQAFKG